MDRILRSLDADDPQIRVAAVWCLINLTWPDDSGIDDWKFIFLLKSSHFCFLGASQRIDELCRRGFGEKLHTMIHDSCLDVRDRVKTAIEHFERSRHSPETI